MNIAYIVPKLANKGPVIVVLELVNQMISNNHKCTVFYFDKEIEIKFPCKTQRISFFHKIDFNSYDIIHTHGLRPDSYIFFHKPFKCKAKFVTTLHNYILDDLTFQYNKLIGCTAGYIWLLFLKRHDRIVTLTKDALKYYMRWFNQNKLSYAYNTRNITTVEDIPSAEKIQINKFKGSSILLGVNAALTPRKGIDQIIEALPYLPEYKLMIIGSGKSLEALKQQSLKNNTSDRILFAGYKKNAYRYLPYYDIYALPSRSEGFVLTLIEAAIFKKNVICSDIAVFKEVVTNEEVSYFKLENIPSLIEAIKRAYREKFLGDKLYKKYQQTFSPQKFYEAYHKIYQSELEK